jgi:hypothetical protein
LLAGERDQPWLRELTPSASDGGRCAPRGAASRFAQIVGAAGGGAVTATGELRAGALPLIQMRFSTPRCDTSWRRLRESLRFIRFGCASTSPQLALPISQPADSSLTVPRIATKGRGGSGLTQHARGRLRPPRERRDRNRAS